MGKSRAGRRIEMDAAPQPQSQQEIVDVNAAAERVRREFDTAINGVSRNGERGHVQLPSGAEPIR
ncbi:hypothetical protein HDA40_003436 [Hamadaea flava]|uniref:Uncharacterized protein n=1 Tax=Hamadaea flava TaxID=1742688 RepID=A0ABV8LJI5_9ACTN|nr:hypothetical protein [Hamadaea flava]MCP2324929.1 hypothetical protein [Hamadaea flava]